MDKFYSTCTDVGQFLLGSWEHQLGGQEGKAGVTGEDRSLGLLLHSAWTQGQVLADLCVILGRTKPWPEAFYLHGIQSLGTASVPMGFLELTNEKNRLHLAFLDGAAFVGQLGKWWHYKSQGDHRAALRDAQSDGLLFAGPEMLPCWRNIPVSVQSVSCSGDRQF